LIYFFVNKKKLLKQFGILPTNHLIIQRWFFALLFLQVLIAGTSLGHMITLYFKPFFILGLSSIELFSEEHFFRICGGGFFVQNFILFLFPKILYGNISYSINSEEENTYQKIKSSFAKQIKPATESNEIHQAVNDYLLQYPFIKKDFSLSQMSFDLKIPERVLSNYFNKELNKTFGEWKNDSRINFAIDLIDKGAAKKITIEAISSEVGFVSRSKFIDAFKSRKGVTPSKYIKEKQV
jgi:AraC-like DNA-binding protein